MWVRGEKKRNICTDATREGGRGGTVPAVLSQVAGVSLPIMLTLVSITLESTELSMAPESGGVAAPGEWPPES